MSDMTECVTTPRVSTEGFDPLGVGVYRGSTIVFKDAADYEMRGLRGPHGYSYGLYGTPTTRTLEAKLTRLEKGTRSLLTPSGQAANTLAVLPFLSAGDGIILGDNIYPPMRDFAQRDLVRMGVDVSFFDPTNPDDLASKLTDKTRIVWLESPGSTTMEVADLPRIAALARSVGALVGVDNTWATPLNFKPLLHGADIVTEALTKFVSGHSDVLMGAICLADDAVAETIRSYMGRFGIGVSPDDASMVLRGFETLGLRLAHCDAVARRIMPLFADNPAIAKVLHPTFSNSLGHEFWKRDFLGSSGVFSVVPTQAAVPFISSALDQLNIFALGASWGGTRSLVAPMPIRRNRTATEWTSPDLVLRFSVGLEDEQELSEDIMRFLAALSQSLKSVGEA